MERSELHLGENITVRYVFKVYVEHCNPVIGEQWVQQPKKIFGFLITLISQGFLLSGYTYKQIHTNLWNLSFCLAECVRKSVRSLVWTKT